MMIPSKEEIRVKKTPTSLHEKKTGWHKWILFLIFCVDVHMGLDPTCVHLSLTPLRVDVINGWPLRGGYNITGHQKVPNEVCTNYYISVKCRTWSSKHRATNIRLHLFCQKLQEVLDTKSVAQMWTIRQSEKQDWSFVNRQPNLKSRRWSPFETCPFQGRCYFFCKASSAVQVSRCMKW